MRTEVRRVMSREELIAANLAVVEAHLHSEVVNEVEKALELHTECVD
jgi:hypothetical protein